MKKIFAIAGIIIVSACGVRKSAGTGATQSTSSNTGFGDTRTRPVEFIDGSTFLLTERAADSSYGFDPSNPVKVGGITNGPTNERRYLNALLGPGGENISYLRSGSCCFFKTPHGLMDSMGLLDHYRVYWRNSRDTFSIYINMYDEGDLYIPVGFNAKKKE
jgi:hypothetical protein